MTTTQFFYTYALNNIPLMCIHLVIKNILKPQKTATRNNPIANKHDHCFSYSVKCSIEDNRSSTSSDEITRIRPKSILKLAK